VLVILLIGALASPRTYASNDNFGIIDNARAGYPTPYAGFAMTYFLNVLYNSWPAVPWLGIALYASLLAAAAVVAFLVIEVDQSWQIQAVTGLLVVCLFMPFMLQVDYSASSILLGGSAIFLLMFKGAQRHSRLCLGLIVLLCISSYSLRRMGFLGSVCFAAPFAFGAFVRATTARRFQIAFVVAVLAALILADHLAYSASMSQDYRRFVAFNDIRKGIHNSPYIRSGIVDSKALAATGWSDNDYWLFERWFYLSEERFNIARIAALKDFVRGGRTIYPELSDSIRLLYSDFSGNISALVAIAALPLIFKRPWSMCWAALALTASIMGALLLQRYWYFPSHIALPLLTLTAFGLLCVSLPVPRVPGLVEWIGVAVLVLFVSYHCIANTIQIISENRDRNGAFRRTLDQLNALPSNSIVLFEGGTLKMDWSDPMRPWSLRPHQIRTGMSIFSPVFYRSLQPLGIHKASELIPFLAKSGRGYVVVNIDTMPHLIKFAREAFGLSIKAVSRGELDSGAQVFMLSLEREENPIGGMQAPPKKELRGR
jgi:hypothetical protein